MLSTPKRNWALFAEMSRPHDVAWIRSQTPEQRLEIYCGLYNLVATGRAGCEASERLEQWAWQQKLEQRRRQIKAYSGWDRLNERSVAADPR